MMVEAHIAHIRNFENQLTNFFNFMKELNPNPSLSWHNVDLNVGPAYIGGAPSVNLLTL